ncbi:complex I subunit 4 family protein [Acidocella sp.]|uniref:complex I subunit 4 family protein n=1 Tax=Acidocella sp. TaxID=50710 RepID=UPI0038D0F63B
MTVLLMPLALLASFEAIKDRQKEYYAWMLVLMTAMNGVFLARDLLLFYIFFELTLIPMFFIIGIWGGPERRYAAGKFFLFTFGGSVFTLAAIIYMGMKFGTFDIINVTAKAQTDLSSTERWWILLGLLAGLAVKVPLFPVHTWLPLAHTEAPTAGSVILAGVLLKTGAYGLLRFAVPLFPHAATAFAPTAMALGVIAIIYGALLAFAQADFKRLVAYSSISHLGFVLLGIYAWNALALQGVVVQMLAHGISTGALFILAGALQERLHTRNFAQLGGLWASLPRLSSLGLFFAIASLGLPGLGNFIGEFLVLLGTWQRHPVFAVIGAFGTVTAAAYALLLVQRAFHGQPRKIEAPDLRARHIAVMAGLAAAIIWLGVSPQPVVDTAAPSLAALRASAVTLGPGAP